MTKAMPTTLADRLSKIVGKKTVAVQYGPVAIDFSPNGLRMVQLKKQGDNLVIHASAQASTTDGQCDSKREFRQFVKQLLKQNNFVGRDVVTCIPPKDVKIMMLTYMRQPGKSDEELIVKRIAERINDDVEDYVIDFMMVRPEALEVQDRSVLVALANRNYVIEHLENLRKTGLTVKMLEVEPTAVRRLISVKHPNDHDTNLMTISMGDAQTYITVLSGRRFIYERDIDFGEQQLIALLCKELEINEREARVMIEHGDHEQLIFDQENEQDVMVTETFYSVLKPLFMELVEDINRALIYAASETRGLPVKHVYLTNRVASWKGIEHFINTLIEVPVSVLVPFEGFENADAFAADSVPRGAVVTGMALHGLVGNG